MNELASGYSAQIDEVTELEWTRLLALFDDASIYQSWTYGTVCWKGSPLSHLVLRYRDVVVAIAQVRLVAVPIIKKGVAYIRWGPLWRLRGQGWNLNHLQQVTLAIRQEYVVRRGLLLRAIPNVYSGDPFYNAVASAWDALGLKLDAAAHTYHTARVDLSRSLEDLRKGLHQRWRNCLKTAEKSGYIVQDGADDQLYDQFTLLYREMLARKRFETTVDIEDFRKIHRAVAPELKLRVFVCEKDGQVLNALVVSAAGDTGIYLLAATGTAGLNGRGAHLLQWRALQWLKERGIRWYDVGGMNAEWNQGVYQFKSGLGGHEVDQIGRFELSGSWLSSRCVVVGERLSGAVRGIKALLQRSDLRPRATAPQAS